MNKISRQESNIVPVQSPDRLIELAIEKGTNVDQLERLMALQKDWNAQCAREAFFTALSQFQSACPPVLKSKQGYDNRYQYAPLDKITSTIQNTLRDCGLTYRWEQKETSEVIEVICIITHVSGHSERTSMSGLADASGSKNAIQAKGSAVQYLRRYTLECALGIATSATDNDGGKPAELIDEKQLADLTALVEEIGNAGKQAMLKWAKIEKIADLPASKYKQAVAALEKRRKA